MEREREYLWRENVRESGSNEREREGERERE
jgi:hypothetical protein